MSQSNFMAMVLFVAFAVFVTMRGELGQYLGLLGIGKAAAGTGVPASSAPAVGTPAGLAAGSAAPTAYGSTTLGSAYNWLTGGTGAIPLPLLPPGFGS